MHPESRAIPEGAGSVPPLRLQAFLVDAASKAFSHRRKVAGRTRSDSAEQALKATYSWAGTQDLLIQELVRTGFTPEESARALLIPHATERYVRELLHLNAIAHGWTRALVTLHDVCAVFLRATPAQNAADLAQLAVMDASATIDDVADALYRQLDQLRDEIDIVERYRAQRRLQRPTHRPRRERELAVSNGGRGD